MLNDNPLGKLPDGSYRVLLDLTVTPTDPTGLSALGVTDHEDGAGNLRTLNNESATVAMSLVHRLLAGTWQSEAAMLSVSEVRYIYHPDGGGLLYEATPEA